MNDPGLDQPIDNADAQAEDTLEHEKSKLPEQDSDGPGVIQEEDESYIEPATWWYASTGFPLIAGTFGPMANAFSLCALVENWRVSIPPGGTEEHGKDIKDPTWLIAVNAVSLVCALIGNTSLLLNMARRVKFAIAQPITILGFWIASILLIILVALASKHSIFHAPGVEDQALTQAYYYAIFAAALYQIISYLMCATVWGAFRGYYSKEFNLTMAQRTLMLQTISFLGYQLLGSLIFSHLEDWKFLDAVYWSDFTLLTVGIGGDFVPKTHAGRSLLFPFAIGGIIILGLVVGSIRSLVLERGKEKMSARMTEKVRQKVVKQLASQSTHKKHSPHAISGIKKTELEELKKEPTEDRGEELQRRKAEFDAMRHVQDLASRERKYFSLALSTAAFAVLWFIGGVVFWKTERTQQWTYFEALYFSYTSILTIGKSIDPLCHHV